MMKGQRTLMTQEKEEMEQSKENMDVQDYNINTKMHLVQVVVIQVQKVREEIHLKGRLEVLEGGILGGKLASSLEAAEHQKWKVLGDMVQLSQKYTKINE